MSTFTEPTISEIKDSCYDLAMQLSYLDKSRFSVREVSKFHKLVSALLDMDSMLDDYEDADESFLDDPNDKASRHHY